MGPRPLCEERRPVVGAGRRNSRGRRTLSDVKSPVTIDELQDGFLYSLVAKVRFDDGASALPR